MLKYEVRVRYNYMNHSPYKRQMFISRYGQSHRKDGPSIIQELPLATCWKQYGKYHRIDGPAAIWYDRYEYYTKGKLRQIIRR